MEPTVLTCESPVQVGGELLLRQVPDDVKVIRTGKCTRGPERSQVTKERLPDVESATGNPFKYLIRRTKALVKPIWELVTETPDNAVSWCRTASHVGTKACNNDKFDAIYTSGPPHSTHLVGLKIHKKTRVPWIADFRDPWARRPWTKTRNPIGQRLIPWMERRVVANASIVVLNNEVSVGDFRNAYPELPPHKFVAIHNGYDPEAGARILALNQKRTFHERTSDTPITICHPGSLYGRRDPTTVLEALKELGKQGFQFRFQQIGSMAPNLDPNQIAKSLGSEIIVETIPHMPQDRLFEHMSMADILLLLQPDGSLMVPGKVYEMLLFDRPIVAVCDSAATSEVLDDVPGAFIAPSREKSKIAVAVMNAVIAMDRTDWLGRREVRRKYDGRRLAGKMAEMVRTLAEGLPR